MSGPSPRAVEPESPSAKPGVRHPLFRLLRSAAVYLGLLLLVGLGLAGAEYIAGAFGLKTGHTQFLRFALLGGYAVAAFALLSRGKR